MILAPAYSVKLVAESKSISRSAGASTKTVGVLGLGANASPPTPSLTFAVRAGDSQRLIEVEDEYIPGVRATEMVVFYTPAGKQFADVVNVVWQKALTCGNPVCGKTHEYRGDDLLLYDD
jgi:hypothetical protein